MYEVDGGSGYVCAEFVAAFYDGANEDSGVSGGVLAVEAGDDVCSSSCYDEVGGDGAESKV